MDGNILIIYNYIYIHMVHVSRSMPERVIMTRWSVVAILIHVMLCWLSFSRHYFWWWMQPSQQIPPTTGWPADLTLFSWLSPQSSLDLSFTSAPASPSHIILTKDRPGWIRTPRNWIGTGCQDGHDGHWSCVTVVLDDIWYLLKKTYPINLDMEARIGQIQFEDHFPDLILGV